MESIPWIKLPWFYVCFATHAVQGISSTLFHHFFARVHFTTFHDSCKAKIDLFSCACRVGMDFWVPKKRVKWFQTGLKRHFHRLTLPEGVYSFRYFLSPMRIPNLVMHIFIMPNPFVICSCIYASCLRIAIRHSMRIPRCIHAWADNKRSWQNDYMHRYRYITRFGIRIGDRKYPNEYTPFGSVSLWVIEREAREIMYLIGSTQLKTKI